jgi:hypothetical protein
VGFFSLASAIAGVGGVAYFGLRWLIVIWGVKDLRRSGPLRHISVSFRPFRVELDWFDGPDKGG